MQQRRNSYFAEKRSTNADPNFFNKQDPDTIRSNVRRILKDIVNGNIIDEDYIYFKNNNVLAACLAESYEQATTAFTTANALRYYKNNIVASNLQPYYVNSSQELMIASAEESKCVRKENVWHCAYDLFTQIRNNNAVDPKVVLMQLCIFKDDINRII